MSWLNNHAVEVTAVGSIFMDCLTLIIIFFNLNQLKLNNRSFNVEINFKVFEQRKAIYKDVLEVVSKINEEKNVRCYLREVDDGYDVSKKIITLKEEVDNSKYLFSKNLSVDLELFMLNLEQALSLEEKISKLKNSDSTAWNKEEQESLQELTTRRNLLLESISEFNTDQFLPYLQVSNFHRNLIKEDAGGFNTASFTDVVIAAPKGLISLIRRAQR